MNNLLAHVFQCYEVVSNVEVASRWPPKIDVAVLKDSTMSFPLEFDYVRISTECERKRKMMTISHSMESASASLPFRK